LVLDAGAFVAFERARLESIDVIRLSATP